MESILKDKSLDFSYSVISLCRKLLLKKEFNVSNQLFRSGTAIGANIAEAFYAESKKDFKHKLKIALKECAETEYWINIVDMLGYADLKTTDLFGKCIELKKILISSVKK